MYFRKLFFWFCFGGSQVNQIVFRLPLAEQADSTVLQAFAELL